MKDRSDIVQHVINRHRAGLLRVRTKNVECECPSCHSMNKFAINVFNGRYGCFSCTLHGVALEAITQRRVEWRSIRGLVAGQDEGSRPTSSPRRAVSLPLWTLGGECWTTGTDDGPGRPLPGLIRRAWEYTLGRGVTASQIETYRASVRAYDNRIYFPFWEGSEVTFWMGRAMDEQVTPKTLEPGNDKPLFGSHVGSWKSGPLFLVEGVFDHLATPNSFATMGSFLSRKQAQEVRLLGPDWVGVLFDPDAASKAMRACRMLWELGVPAVSVRLKKTNDDPGKIGWARMSAATSSLASFSPKRPQELFLQP